MNEVEQIKDRLDIVEVVGGYVPLKQAGSNWKGLSPFKSEKTASFMVSAEKGIWHDFSSGQGGDVFSFVMLMEGIDFREALEMLAKRAGVELKPRSHSAQSSAKTKNPIYEVLEQAMKYYHLSLSKSPTALEYLTKTRQLKSETIKNFRLGYSSDSWDSLSLYLQKKGYTHDQLITAGLARKKTGRDTIYDLFRDRIMFPVFDVQGRVVGFSARVLSADPQAAKYINTPESPVYHKSNVLYGLMQAKPSIRKLDEVVVVEGNVDVLSAFNAGFENIVAASGTALTLEQLRILSRLTKNIKLCFDQDSAGIKATAKALELATDFDIKLMVISLGDAKDPDELITRDSKLWQKAVETALYAPDYIFSIATEQFDTKTALGKKQFANFVLPVMASLHDEIELAHYIKQLAQIIDVPETTLQKKLQDGLERKPVRVVESATIPTNANPSKPKRQLTKVEKIERITLELMLSCMAARDALSDVDIRDISDAHKEIFTALRNHPKANTTRIAKLLPKRTDYVKILSLRGEHVYADLSEHDARLEAFTQIHRLKRINRDKAKRQLTAAIAKAESAGNQKEVNALLQTYQLLLNED